MNQNKRQLQKEQTKKQIINAAYQIYAEKGFSAATSDIAKAGKVSHGTIFVHFPTRDDLLVYLMEDFNTIITARLHELTEESHSIAEILTAHLCAIEENEAFYTRLVTENQLLPAEVRISFIAIQSAIAFHLAQVMDMERAALKSGIPDSFIFNSWVGLIHYYLQNHDLFAPDSSVIKRCKSELVENFLKLIKQ